MQRFNLPSLQSTVKISTGISLRVIRCNCTGTALAGVTDDGFLHIFYADDFKESELISAKVENKEDKKKKKDERKVNLQEQEAVDDLTKMLGFDGEVQVDRKQQQVVTSETAAQRTLTPWDT